MISSSAGRLAGRSSRHAGRRLASRRTSGPLARWMAPTTALRHVLPSLCYYSTERILELRSGRKPGQQPRVLYDASHEKENCGVGLVASLKSIASRKVVEDADEMLVRMSHRGGCGCDPASGDGAGMSLCLKFS